MTLLDDFMSSDLVRRLGREKEMFNNGRAPNPLAGLLGPEELNINPVRNVPVLGGAVGAAEGAILHPLGLLGEAGGQFGKTAGGEFTLLQALLSIAMADDAKLNNPNDTEIQAANAALDLGPLHPGRVQDTVRNGPDSRMAWQAGANQMILDPNNLNPARLLGLINEATKGVKAARTAAALKQGVAEGDNLLRPVAEASQGLALDPNANALKKYMEGLGLGAPEKVSDIPSDLAPKKLLPYDKGLVAGANPTLPSALNARRIARQRAELGLDAPAPENLAEVLRKPAEPFTLPLSREQRMAQELANSVAPPKPRITTALPDSPIVYDPVADLLTQRAEKTRLANLDALVRGLPVDGVAPASGKFDYAAYVAEQEAEKVRRANLEELVRGRLGAIDDPALAEALRKPADPFALPPPKRASAPALNDVPVSKEELPVFDYDTYSAERAAGLARLAGEKAPSGQLGLAEDLANSVGDKGTGYDRFVTRLTAITKKEGEVPPSGSSFWTEVRGGSFTPEEVQRYFARARHEGILGDNLDAVLPEPNLSNVNILSPEPLADGGAASRVDELSGDKGKIAIDALKQLAYGAKETFAWPALLRRIKGREDRLGRVWVGDQNVTEHVFEYLYERPGAKTKKAADALADQLNQRITESATGALAGSSINFISPLKGLATLGKAAANIPGVVGGVQGAIAYGAPGAAAGAILGATADPEDRWRGALKGAASGAVLGAAVGGTAGAWSLSHYDAKTIGLVHNTEWQKAKDAWLAARDRPGVNPGLRGFGNAWRTAIVSKPRQFTQDAIWQKLALLGAQGKSTLQYMKPIAQDIARNATLTGNARRSTYVQDALALAGYNKDLNLGAGQVEAVARNSKDLSVAQSAVAQMGISLLGGPTNVGGVLFAGAKGAAMPFIAQYIRGANAQFNEVGREAAFVDELQEKLLPQMVRIFKEDFGYDVSSIPMAQLGHQAVAALHGPKAGAMWARMHTNAIEAAAARSRHLFGDYTKAEGVRGVIENIVGTGIPFSSWAIRAYPVALEMAIQHPYVTMGIYQYITLMSKLGQGQPGYTAGMLPVSTEVPGLGMGVRGLLGGQKGTAYIDPVSAVSPTGGGMFAPPDDASGEQSLYQQVSDVLGRTGLPGFNPLIGALAFILGLDYKAPTNLSSTKGVEDALGLLPGNVAVPDVGGGALRLARGKASPLFAATDLGAAVGAEGDAHPTVFDPVARRYGELVVKLTGKPLSAPDNRAYLYDMAAGTGELYDRARREVLVSGAARNTFNSVSPFSVAVQSEDNRTARKERKGTPATYADILAQEQGPNRPNIGMPSLRSDNAKYAKAHPWAAAYDVGSADEGRAMLLADAAARYRTGATGVQHSPQGGQAELARVMQSNRLRAEAQRIPPKK